jgi:predicted glutamine amidotransferase
MCRMLGVMCNDEDLLGCAIHEVRDSLEVKDKEQRDGYGVGYYCNDEPLLKKHPSTSSGEIDYEHLVEDISSNVLVVHLRQRTPGPWKEANSHPFRFRNWLFAHVGHLPALLDKREGILKELAPFLARDTQGDTDGELAFHFFLDHLYKQGNLNDLTQSSEHLSSSLKACVGEIEKMHAAAKKPATFAMLVTNGQVMAAACRAIPMHYSHREGIQECSRHEPSDQQRRVHRRFKAIMLGAKMFDPGHQWREVADGSLLSISKSLELRVEQL